MTLGAAVKLGYFAQHSMEVLERRRDRLRDAARPPSPPASIGSLRALAGCFGFSGDEIEKRCRLLSGGEKARLVLARMLYDPPNLLVLDEPTNHLDLATKEMLIAALSGFEGTLLLVSHDRRFLAALTNRVLELTPGSARVYGGGYLEYVDRQRPRGARHARPEARAKGDYFGREGKSAIVRSTAFATVAASKPRPMPPLAVPTHTSRLLFGSTARIASRVSVAVVTPSLPTGMEVLTPPPTLLPHEPTPTPIRTGFEVFSARYVDVSKLKRRSGCFATSR